MKISAFLLPALLVSPVCLAQAAETAAPRPALEEAPPRASAQPQGKIGIVSVDRVFKEYKATQAKEAEFQKLAISKQADREKMVTEIRNLRDELALLNEDSRNKQKQAIDQKLQALAAFDQQVRESLRDQREEAISGLLKEIEQVVTSMAKDKGFDLILSDRAVLYRVDALDLTDQVISVLNQKAGKGGKSG